ncbi:MAG TPA: hypothetical protein VNV43_03470 [Candidatus Acidoferrales bacterium]|nr:hypothetical protein [Candidatus Acidoferrales bacterium]
MKSVQRNNWLWLIIVPPLLSLALISGIKPSGPFAFWTEISIFCLCSLLCGFALALKQFKKFKHRLWGTIAYSTAGMYLICCMSFLGCFWLEERGPRLTPAQIQQSLYQDELERRAGAAKDIVARDSLADPSMLDLSPYCDGIVSGPGRTFEGDSFLQFPKPGTHMWDGIKFDVRGTIGSSWLVETNAVFVGRKCSEVDFLHGASAGNPSDLVNQFFIHFQDGRTVTVPIIYGTDVSSDIFENGVVPANAVAWGEFLFTNAPPRPFTGFFITRWKNPSPDEIIRSIGFAPRKTGFLVAITVQEGKN